MFKSTLPPVVPLPGHQLCCSLLASETVRGMADASLSEPGGVICGVAVQSKYYPSSPVVKQQHSHAHGQQSQRSTDA